MTDSELAEHLLFEAEKETPKRPLEAFSEVITLLRDQKNFTFREIADWLNSAGQLETDHNAVWRCYTKHMHPADAEDEARQDEETERGGTDF